MYTENFLIRFRFLIFSFHSYKDNHYLTFMVALLRLFIKKYVFYTSSKWAIKSRIFDKLLSLVVWVLWYSSKGGLNLAKIEKIVEVDKKKILKLF